MRTLLIAGLFYCWIPVVVSQGLYSVRNYKAIDGLPQSQVNIMLEDKNGYLWIGTQGGGLARFDGREFIVYTTMDGLLSNIISFLKLDDNQNLWIIHPRGITKFDGIRFKTFNQPGPGLNAKRMRRIFAYKDTLFFTSGQGELGKIYNDSVYYWTRKYDNKLVRYCHVDRDKNVVMYLSDSTFLVWSQFGEYTLHHKDRFNRLQAMFNFNDQIWLRTDSGHFLFDLKKREFIQKDFPVKNHVVYHDTINDVLWTRYASHLLKEKISGTTVKIDTAIRDIAVTQVLVDSEGNTWFATDGAGLYKYFIQDFDRCSSENLKGVWAIFIDSRGASWVGSNSKGLWKIKKGKASSYIDKREPYRNDVFCVSESPAGDIWVGTNYGIGKYNESTDTFKWFTRDDGLSNASVLNMQFDESGGLWLGTFGGGVNYFDGKNFKYFTIRDGLGSNIVNSLHYSKSYKKLFVGNEFGLSSISAERKIQSIPLSGIENTAVTSINSYQDSLLLIGSAGAGIAIYNPKNYGKKVITTHHGLASDFIYFVAADYQNYIWIGTEKGITRIRLNRAFDIEENLHYDYDNGLTGVETNQNAFYLGREKKYFGLIDGLYQFNDVKREGRKSFDLHLTDVQLSYNEYDIREYSDSLMGFFKIPHNPNLPPEKNHITFHFNRVDKRYPKSVKFKYFLENFDKTWSRPSSSNQVTYSNLPPGRYTFRVTSTNNEGSWSAAQVYGFTIKTPFYQTASFIVGMFILFAGIVTLVLYIRVKQRVNHVVMLERIRSREQETLRKEIARDFHDEMGNQLTRIINYVSLLKLNGNGNGGGHDLYTKVEDSAKYLYNGTRDFIWAIDPGNDELSRLFLHIRDFGEKLFEEKNIKFRAFNEIKDPTKLPYGFSREANLIFKEAMTNAFKYSSAKNVTLSLHRNEDDFEMRLEDDGVGFYTGEIEKSNGLKNIRERASRINAILRIQSLKNQGTKIVLNFKLNKTLKYGLTV